MKSEDERLVFYLRKIDLVNHSVNIYRRDIISISSQMIQLKGSKFTCNQIEFVDDGTKKHFSTHTTQKRNCQEQNIPQENQKKFP